MQSASVHSSMNQTALVAAVAVLLLIAVEPADCKMSCGTCHVANLVCIVSQLHLQWETLDCALLCKFLQKAFVVHTECNLTIQLSCNNVFDLC